MAAIAPSEIETWLATMQKADSTRTKALQILRQILDLARRDRALATNPADEVKPPGTESTRIGRALSDDDITAILDAAETTDESTAAVVWLMARAGLRIGEALALRRSDVDLANGTLKVQRSEQRFNPVEDRVGGPSYWEPA